MNGSLKGEEKLAREAIAVIRAWIDERKGGQGREGKPCLAIKFCGGCNPSIERGPLARIIRQDLGDEVSWRAAEEEVDLLLIIDGCLTACADRPEVKERAGEYLAIAGPTISFIKRMESGEKGAPRD